MSLNITLHDFIARLKASMDNFSNILILKTKLKQMYIKIMN